MESLSVIIQTGAIQQLLSHTLLFDEPQELSKTYTPPPILHCLYRIAKYPTAHQTTTWNE